MNLTFFKTSNLFTFLLVCFVSISALNAQVAEFRFGEPEFDPIENRYHYPIQVKSDISGTLNSSLRIISSTTDFDFENSRLTDLMGITLQNPHNGNSDNNNGPYFGFPCDFFYKSGTATISINDASTIGSNQLNTWIDLAVFELGVLSTNPNPNCPTLIFDNTSLGGGYTVGYNGINATVLNGNVYHLMEVETNQLNWTESNPSFTPYGAPIEQCMDVECESTNPLCLGIDAQFRIGEPVFDLFENQLHYPIQINAATTGKVESNVRLITSTAFYNDSNTKLSDVNLNILDGHILETSAGNGGELFGLPCEIIRVSGNVEVDVLQANTWQDIAILEAGVNGNIPVSFCPSIVFDKNSDCVGFIPPSAGLQAIINVNNGLSQAMNETVQHLNWQESNPNTAPYGYQIEACGEYVCVDDECEELITIEQRIRTKKSRLLISYDGAAIPNNRNLTECCITWETAGIPPIPCPNDGPYPNYNYNPLHLFNGTPYSATVTCGTCTVVFIGIAGEPLGATGRFGMENNDRVEVHPNLIQNQFIVRNLIDAKTLKIVSAAGATVYNSDIPLNASSFNMNIENYENGIYILIIENMDGSFQTEKIIKQ